ncbi:energy-coupling factor ABC transporter ATP-binding protein [Gudongella oleilytica]|jgi:energy-coupling factor transport system ATP-binding protein|uniref:energy-coupling factor ABC transporter ATP-binding protein n=1 Tax=Gudongella oleilytica TaxID=1582259 RepID=UPI000FF89E4F|nr:ABC transporter ATP-binding protein [Gudongella oleilytica]
MKPFIVFENVDFKYRRSNNIFQSLVLAINSEETTAITGNNGSGKTTLSKLAAGMLHPQKGRVVVDGEDIKEMSLGELGTKLGYVFQAVERQLFGMTVLDELTFVNRLKGIEESETYAKANKLLEAFELTDLRDRHPSTLSYGEKRRLAIAAALMSDISFLILDEPTSFLDPDRIESLSSTLDSLKANGVGMLIISHDEDFVARHADRIIRIEDGGIVDDHRH